MKILKILGALFFGFIALVLIVAMFDSQPDLRVVRQDFFLRDDGMALEIVNIGKGPISVTAIVINDRTECARTSPFPINLKVGDQALQLAQCRIIRATFKTKEGSATYTFK